MGLSTSLSGARMKPNPKHPKNQHPLSLQCPIQAPQTTEGGFSPEGDGSSPRLPTPSPSPITPQTLVTLKPAPPSILGCPLGDHNGGSPHPAPSGGS